MPKRVVSSSAIAPPRIAGRRKITSLFCLARPCRAHDGMNQFSDQDLRWRAPRRRCIDAVSESADTAPSHASRTRSSRHVSDEAAPSSLRIHTGTGTHRRAFARASHGRTADMSTAIRGSRRRLTEHRHCRHSNLRRPQSTEPAVPSSFGRPTPLSGGCAVKVPDM